MASEPKIQAGKLILPAGMTEEEARRWIEAEIAESHADDARSLQILGAAMIREHKRVSDLQERLLSGIITLHDVGEAGKLLLDLRHEIGRAKGTTVRREEIRRRWQEKLDKLGKE